MTEEWFSPSEIKRMTKCAKVDAQCAQLDALGVPYRLVGRAILVSRIHVRQWLLGEKLRQSAGPRLDLVR